MTPNSKAHVVFDLFLNIIESDAGLRLDCDYNTDLFDGATIECWLECYQALLEDMLADPAQPLWRAALLPAAERARLLYGCNDTARDFPRERCLHELLEARAAAQPGAIAVRFADEELSYETLHARANQLAALLLARLDGRPVSGRRVAVALERSTDLLVALLAVLKAGCAYVPLEPKHPVARLRHILTDAGVAALLTDGAVAAELVPDGTLVVHLGAERAALAALPAIPPHTQVTAGDLAYVMYTSGSTGLPKGVEVTHRAVVNFLSSMAREPGLSAHDVLLAVTTVSFDIAGLELYLPLLVGARVVIAAREVSTDGFALRAQLERCAVTAMQATPATWRLLLEAGFRAPAGFKMLCGGEALPRELAAGLLGAGGELWNLYGPTETTIWSSCARVVDATAPISVGRPIANTQFYVLDTHDQPLPPGVPGELHIGGEGVARGYHEQAELTAQKFLGNPFAPGRLFRSGDRARWLPDGQLQLLGRTDQQIKLRGFRIELGEIESALMQFAQVQAAVLLREDSPGAARLVGYYLDASGSHTPAEPARSARQRAARVHDPERVGAAAAPAAVGARQDRTRIAAGAAGRRRRCGGVRRAAHDDRNMSSAHLGRGIASAPGRRKYGLAETRRRLDPTLPNNRALQSGGFCVDGEAASAAAHPARGSGAGRCGAHRRRSARTAADAQPVSA